MKKTFILYMIILSILTGGCSPFKKIMMPREDDGKPAGELTGVKARVEERGGGEVEEAPDAAPEASEHKPEQESQPIQEQGEAQPPQEEPAAEGGGKGGPDEAPESLQEQMSNADATPSPEDVQESPQASNTGASPMPNAGSSPEAASAGENGTAPTPSTEPGKASSSSAPYSVRVVISEQKVYVYQEDEVVKAMVCSTGIEDEQHKTPRGEFIINESGRKRGEWFYEPKFQQGAKYWVGFIGGNFLFHSVPMDEKKNVIESEEEKLGRPASHGCIRLSLEDAYWFYSTIPSGTRLIIED